MAVLLFWCKHKKAVCLPKCQTAAALPLDMRVLWFRLQLYLNHSLVNKSCCTTFQASFILHAARENKKEGRSGNSSCSPRPS